MPTHWPVQVVSTSSLLTLDPNASRVEGDMGDSHVGLQARLMSQALRKITGIVKQTNATMVFVNKIRMKIGVMFKLHLRPLRAVTH